MQTVSVAIVDDDCERRAWCEHLLEDEFNITILADITSNIEVDSVNSFENSRLKTRKDTSENQDQVVRIKRLKPRIVLINLNSSSNDVDYSLFLSLRRECPEVLVILMGDSIHEDILIHALELGARGYVKNENIQNDLSKAIQAVGRGEPWISRKLLGSIMNRELSLPAKETPKSHLSGAGFALTNLFY